MAVIIVNKDSQFSFENVDRVFIPGSIHEALRNEGRQVPICRKSRF